MKDAARTDPPLNDVPAAMFDLQPMDTPAGDWRPYCAKTLPAHTRPGRVQILH